MGKVWIRYKELSSPGGWGGGWVSTQDGWGRRVGFPVGLKGLAPGFRFWALQWWLGTKIRAERVWAGPWISGHVGWGL